MLVSDLQPENAYLPIEATPSGITMLANDLQPFNAESPMTEAFGILTELRDGHPEKAFFPITFMLSGRLICFNAVQFAKPLSAIRVTILP